MAQKVYYLHGDHLGSGSLTTNNNGASVSACRYYPYGQERGCTGEDKTDFGFTGQRNEGSFGLMDYNARYYSARLGRFISPDTIIADPLDSNSYNRYAYVNNNPINHTDPTGHICEECGSDFLLGIGYQWSANNLDALLVSRSGSFRQPVEEMAARKEFSLAFQSGRFLASVGSMAQGAIEMASGGAMIGGGTAGGALTAPTGVGIVAGAAVDTVGLGVFAHGAAVGIGGAVGMAESANNILNMAKGGGGGSNLARKIANGHASSDNPDRMKEFQMFGIRNTEDLTQFTDEIMQYGQSKRSQGKTAYWMFDTGDDYEGTIVIVDPKHPDGGTIFRPDRGVDYFWELWE